MSIFKACEIRGAYPDEMNEEKAYRISRAVATMLDSGTVVVGGDVRTSTPGLKTALIDGLTASSCDVVDIGTVSTPLFHYVMCRLHAAGAVMVTSSHHPADTNGAKVFFDNLPATTQQLHKIKSMIETNGFLCRRGRVTTLDAVSTYEDHIRCYGDEMFNGIDRRPKVVMDCGNGCNSEIAPKVFESLGMPVIRINCDIDGTFPGRGPNPTPASLKELCSAVIETESDFGIAFDGDGDRVVFVDESGKVLTSDQATAVIARYMRGVSPGESVVLDTRCSSAVADVVSMLGATTLTERSGYAAIRTRMVTECARFGAETDGHLFYRELEGGDDALFTALLMSSIVADYGALSLLAAAIPNYATTPNLRIHARPDPSLLDMIAEAFPLERVDRLDGVKVLFEDGWGLARVATHEPEVQLRFEGVNECALRRIMDEFLAPAPGLRKAVMQYLQV
ncbi:MAG: phosphomannomutase/phosphoglucomutase [Armatimonadota bacterium]|nr:phosphomannomutase/phosphoglucomutase [bacterium]